MKVKHLWWILGAAIFSLALFSGGTGPVRAQQIIYPPCFPGLGYPLFVCLPGASPSAPPTGSPPPLILTPTSLTFIAGGSPQPFVASQTGGSFSVYATPLPSCASVVQSGATFNVTPGTTVCTTTVVVAGVSGSQATEGITVNASPTPPPGSPSPIPSASAGAQTEAALVADYQAAGNSTYPMDCWPMNDSVGTGNSFSDYCQTNGNDLSFQFGNYNGFTTNDLTPVLASAVDSSSVDYTGMSYPMTTESGPTPAGNSWTWGFLFNAPTPTQNGSIINSGTPTNGDGIEVYLTSAGKIVFTLGKAGGGDYTITSTPTIAANTTHFVAIKWSETSSGQGTACLYIDFDTPDCTTITSPLYAYSGNTQMSVAYPTGTGASYAYIGNFAWLWGIQTALSDSAIHLLASESTGPVNPVTSPSPGAVQTAQLADQFSTSGGFDSFFYGYTSKVETFQTAAAVQALEFLNPSIIRSSPGSGTGPAGTQANTFVKFCSAGIGFSYPINWLQENTPGTGSASSWQSGLVTVAQIQSAMDSVKTNQGCYPTFIESNNEGDNYNDSASYGPNYEYAYDSLIDGSNPSHVCTFANSSATLSNDPACDVPRWAYYDAVVMQTFYNAVNCVGQGGGTCKYSGIQIYGPSLEGASHWPEVSQAWHDINGNTLFPVTVANQHAGPASPTAAPDGAHGVTAAIVNKPYATTSGGFSGYVPLGQPSALPQRWTEYGEARASVYDTSYNGISEPLATHYVPRLALALTRAGVLGPNDQDFLSDQPSFKYNNSFGQEGILDTIGNLKPSGYAVANMMAMVGWEPPAVTPLTSATNITYNVYSAGTTTTPSNLVTLPLETDDGRYWIELNDPSEEAQHYTGTLGSCSFSTGAPANCLGVAENFVGFTSVNITGLPTSIKAAAVYQNDEYCNATRTQQATPYGLPLVSYVQGATGANAGSGTDCFQYWPAGYLGNTIQKAYYNVVNGNIMDGTNLATIKYNGMPLFVEVGASQLPVIPTMTPLPYVAPATPSPQTTPTPSGATPSPNPYTYPTLPPTPIPSFHPPTGSVPTPPNPTGSSPPLTLSPTSLSFFEGGAAQPFTATQAGGTFSIIATPAPLCASVSQSGATFSVTPGSTVCSSSVVVGGTGGTQATEAISVASPVPASSAEALDTRLLITEAAANYWRAGETSGTTVNDLVSGASDPITLSGPTTDYTPGPTPWDSLPAVQCNGSSVGVTSANVPGPVTSFTLEMAMKLHAVGTGGVLATLRRSAGQNSESISLWVGDNGKVTDAIISDPFTLTQGVNSAITDTNWHWVDMAFYQPPTNATASVLTTYVDGNPVTGSSYTGGSAIATFAGLMNICGAPSLASGVGNKPANLYFNGEVGRVALVLHAISQADAIAETQSMNLPANSPTASPAITPSPPAGSSPSPSPVVISPSSASLTYPGPAGTYAVSQVGCSSFSITTPPSNPPAMASLTGSTLTVTPEGVGSTTLTITGCGSQTAQATIGTQALVADYHPFEAVLKELGIHA